MTVTTAPPRTTAQLRLPVFVAALWVALATALLSSLIPGGLPRTTHVGSAFHPSTSSVVLQPNRAQPRVATETVRRDDGQTNGQGDIALASGVVEYPAPLISQPETMPLVRRAPSPTLHAVFDGSPRGPPLN